MKITSATFMRGLKGDNEILHDGIPQIAFIGRSNVGKSSMMNTLTNQRKLARTSNTPGRTQEINVFLINNTHYFLDLPGYAFARTKMKIWQKLDKLITWYLFKSEHCHTVVLLIDAEIGPTGDDIEMLEALRDANKDIIVVLNKVDKIKKSHYLTQITKLAKQLEGYMLVPFSSETRVGVEELAEALLS
ncbi:MAG: putative GTP-binding protein EngB [Candidatus Parcubacteria bacterium]|jgi:GTP-binding protein